MQSCLYFSQENEGNGKNTCLERRIDPPAGKRQWVMSANATAWIEPFALAFTHTGRADLFDSTLLNWLGVALFGEKIDCFEC